MAVFSGKARLLEVLFFHGSSRSFTLNGTEAFLSPPDCFYLFDFAEGSAVNLNNMTRNG